jgi:hypothetical protein
MVGLRDLLHDPTKAEVTDLTENLGWISDYATQAGDSTRLGIIFDRLGMQPQTPDGIRLYEIYVEAGKPTEVPTIDEEVLEKLSDYPGSTQLEIPTNKPRLRFPQYTTDPLTNEGALNAWLELYHRMNQEGPSIDMQGASVEAKQNFLKSLLAKDGTRLEDLKRDRMDHTGRS